MNTSKLESQPQKNIPKEKYTEEPLSQFFRRDDFNFSAQYKKLQNENKKNTQVNSECSDLIISLPSPKKPAAFRKLTYDQENEKKKFKRIRVATSDSDSENEHSVKRTKARDFYDGYDLSVRINSEEMPKDDKNSKNSSLSFSLEGDNFNYDVSAYLIFSI